MIQWRTVITTLLVAFVTTVGVYADMMPISPSNAVSSPSACPCNHANSEPISGYETTADLGFLSVASFTEGPTTTEPIGPTQPSVQVLTTDRSSLDLCLYTLIGLGLCRSGHWVRRSGLGVVPEWYHTGGPYQIGRSHALEPNTLCPVSVCCFIQPDDMAATPLTPCVTAVTATLRRQSQHTPTALAPRGPPLS